MFTVLCYAEEKLVMASVPADIEEGNLVEVLGEDYLVVTAGSIANMMTGASRVVELEKYKQKRKKVG